MYVDIYEKGQFKRRKDNGNLIIVDYVEISTKGGKSVYKVHAIDGTVYDAKDLY